VQATLNVIVATFYTFWRSA